MEWKSWEIGAFSSKLGFGEFLGWRHFLVPKPRCVSIENPPVPGHQGLRGFCGAFGHELFQLWHSDSDCVEGAWQLEILLMATRNPANSPVEVASLPHSLQGFSTIPGGCLGVLNHQQYHRSQVWKMMVVTPGTPRPSTSLHGWNYGDFTNHFLCGKDLGTIIQMKQPFIHGWPSGSKTYFRTCGSSFWNVGRFWMDGDFFGRKKKADSTWGSHDDLVTIIQLKGCGFSWRQIKLLGGAWKGAKEGANLNQKRPKADSKSYCPKSYLEVICRFITLVRGHITHL